MEVINNIHNDYENPEDSSDDGEGSGPDVKSPQTLLVPQEQNMTSSKVSDAPTKVVVPNLNISELRAQSKTVRPDTQGGPLSTPGGETS